MSDIGLFLDEVEAEVTRARIHFPDQEYEVDLPSWLAILVEEVGEVARALNERLLGNETDPGNIQAELVQVAAMAYRMTSAVEKRWTNQETPA